MKRYHLSSSILVKESVEHVFPFFDDPKNLEKLTPNSLSFSILTPDPIKMAHGACIDYVVTILGLPMRWTSLIQAYEPMKHFVDVQLKGPYAFWHHTHRFEPTPDGTLIHDDVYYSVPFGWLGRLLHSLLIKRQLLHIFNYRIQVMNGLFTLDLSRSKPVSIQ